MEKSATFVMHPEIDILFGSIRTTIPSKTNDFKPIKKAVIINDNGHAEILNDFYQKKPTSQSVKKFTDEVRKQLIDAGYTKNIIKKPKLVEVVIAISLPEKMFFNVDLDNISKTVLDALTGYLFDDDSQVVKLICNKDIHPAKIPGYFIALTEITDKRKGILGDLHLFSSL